MTSTELEIFCEEIPASLRSLNHPLQFINLTKAMVEQTGPGSRCAGTSQQATGADRDRIDHCRFNRFCGETPITAPMASSKQWWMLA
jgi:hypothetical protein